MRISDWSSDVCSSDLGHEGQRNHDIASLCPFRAEYEGHEVGRNGSRAEEYGAGHKRAGACYPQIGGPDLPRFVMHLRECGKGCRSEEHTSELQSLMRISYAVFCLKKKNRQ